MSQSTTEQQQKTVAVAAAAQQSDNISHALAGAGGGILSMILTCVAPHQQ
jgi:adenine nucleotide transporter 17